MPKLSKQQASELREVCRAAGITNAESLAEAGVTPALMRRELAYFQAGKRVAAKKAEIAQAGPIDSSLKPATVPDAGPLDPDSIYAARREAAKGAEDG